MEDLIKRLLNAKIDPSELAVAMNMEYLCYDIGSLYSLEVESLLKRAGAFKHQDKAILNKIKALHQKLTKSLDLTLGAENAEGFGEMSDFLREVMELAANADENQRLKILSTMKLIIKK